MVESRVAKVLRPWLLCISKVIGESLCRLHMSVVAPRPIMRLKAGPAMHPVTAISPNPFAAIDLLANTSPSEFPHDSSVSPSSEEGS